MSVASCKYTRIAYVVTKKEELTTSPDKYVARPRTTYMSKSVCFGNKWVFEWTKTRTVCYPSHFPTHACATSKRPNSCSLQHYIFAQQLKRQPQSAICKTYSGSQNKAAWTSSYLQASRRAYVPMPSSARAAPRIMRGATFEKKNNTRRVWPVEK